MNGCNSGATNKTRKQQGYAINVFSLQLLANGRLLKSKALKAVFAELITVTKAAKCKQNSGQFRTRLQSAGCPNLSTILSSTQECRLLDPPAAGPLHYQIVSNELAKLSPVSPVYSCNLSPKVRNIESYLLPLNPVNTRPNMLTGSTFLKQQTLTL